MIRSAVNSISIIIPAHNEAAVIARLLENLANATDSYYFQIIVVCNGCSDNTAELVSRYSEVEFIETDIPSKTNALNLGDSVATGDIRVYMDADIVMSAVHVKLLIDALRETGIEAVVPAIHMNFSRASWFVKAYYDIWLSLPYVQQGIMGGGVYALSRAGRARFAEFPDVISDDGYVMGLFADSELKCVPEAISEVTPPRTLSGLIQIKTRSRLGLYQLFERFPELRSNHAKSYGNPVMQMTRSPSLWGKMFVYLGINLYCKYRARRLLNSDQKYRWETDSSSRI